MDNEQCRVLIRKYEIHRVLWDAKLKNYHNREYREDAWRAISHEMQIPVCELKRKMTALMGSYRREKSRRKRRLRSAQGGIYTSKWFAFDCFSFLSGKDAPNETTDTTADPEAATELEPSTAIETTAEDKETQTAICSDNRSIQTIRAPVYKIPTAPHSRKKRAADADQDTMFTEAYNLLHKRIDSPTDPYIIFGQHIANELRKYDPRTLAHVKHAINNIVFDADMGKYIGTNNYGYHDQPHVSSQRPYTPGSVAATYSDSSTPTPPPNNQSPTPTSGIACTDDEDEVPSKV